MLIMEAAFVFLFLFGGVGVVDLGGLISVNECLAVVPLLNVVFADIETVQHVNLPGAFFRRFFVFRGIGRAFCDRIAMQCKKDSN